MIATEQQVNQNNTTNQTNNSVKQPANKMSKHNQQNQNNNNQQIRKAKIVQRVSNYPMINMAISLGYNQYEKLKSSNVTVGDVMSKAEGLAMYFWQKVQPIVVKFQEPITKADQLACDTLDFFESKVTQLRRPS